MCARTPCTLDMEAACASYVLGRRVYTCICVSVRITVCVHAFVHVSHASVHVVQDQSQLFRLVRTRSRSMQDIVMGGGGYRTPGSVQTIYSREFGGISQ